MGKEMKRLIQDLQATPGWRVEHTKNQHWRFYAPDGITVIHASGTPSDHRAMKNLMAQLRRAGYDPKGG